MSASDPKTLRELRRAQIVAAARSLVGEGGLEALTFGALEKRLEFSRGVITYHFANKDEIVEAVLRSAVAEIDAATTQRIKASAGFEEKVHAMLAGTVEGFIGCREAAQILVAFWGRIPNDPRATKLNAELYAGYRAAALELLTTAKKKGLLAKGLKLEPMAAAFVAMVLGTVMQVYFEPEAIDAERVIHEAAAAFISRLSA